MASGYSGANRREARKLGLLPSGKSSEAERERMEPQERNERVCGGCSDDMLILIEEGPAQMLLLYLMCKKFLHRADDKFHIVVCHVIEERKGDDLLPHSFRCRKLCGIFAEKGLKMVRYVVDSARHAF